VKTILRKLCAPLLRHFESGSGAYTYKPLYRYALLFICTVFCLLAAAVASLAGGKDWANWLPVLIFGATGGTGLIIGLLGTDRAVARLWHSEK
jgi:hypothetical protein